MPFNRTFFKNGIRVETLQQTLTPVSVAAATCAEQTFVISPLQPVIQNINPTDVVEVFWPGSATAVGIVGARVTALNTIAITFVNPTLGALVPTAGVYTIIVWPTKANTP